ncbi:MAG: glycosyltransferase [Sphaerochaeta sp.]|nr:glycosyltransferase [Sphaerochaeta sp.]
MILVLINPTFQKMQFCKRWSELAAEHPDLDITLVLPTEFEWSGFGFSDIKTGESSDDLNFHKRAVPIVNRTKLGWISKGMINLIDEIKPDVVYHIGSHNQPSLMQLLEYKANKCPSLNIYAFSMRGPVYDLDHLYSRIGREKKLFRKALRFAFWVRQVNQVKKLNRYCDAIFCHYPDALHSFRKEGFKGPIYIQTQVGVDTDLFYPNPTARNIIREKYNLEESYVFGSAIRLEPAKGALQIIEALPDEGSWKYLLMGAGTEENEKEIIQKIEKRGLKEKVILTGFIKPEDMPDYWNAVDCAIHFAQSTEGWVETFSLAVVQAMATQLPVIGSSSGSVPYQIGEDGIVVDEHDIHLLRGKIEWVLDNQDEAKKIGNKLYKRTINSFSTKSLNKLFYRTIMNLQEGIYDQRDIEMACNNSEISC